MRRVLSAMLALAVALAAFAAQSVAMPGRVFACSCAAPLPALAEYARNGAAIFTGTAGAVMLDRIPVAVETWYGGPGMADTVWIRPAQMPAGNGQVVVNTCSLDVAAGQRRFFVVHGQPPEPFDTSICSPNALLDTPEGDALVAEAGAIFGGGQVPPSPEPQAPAPIDIAPWLGGLGWVAALVTAALAMFGVLVLVARRRPSG